MSAFLCGTLATCSAMVRRASSRMSVLKMLYSVSSTVKELALSGVPSVVPTLPSSKPAPAPRLKPSRTFFSFARSEVKS